MATHVAQEAKAKPVREPLTTETKPEERSGMRQRRQRADQWHEAKILFQGALPGGT